MKYEKSISLPNSGQVNPVVNDFNPLSIKVGNTDLTPEKVEEFNMRMNLHNFSTSSSFFTYLMYKRTSNFHEIVRCDNKLAIKIIS